MNPIISDAQHTAERKLMQYNNIVCSISGGSDSDIVLDLIYRLDTSKKVKYVWIDTGLEYQATKDHISYLENKYDIEILRERAEVPIPLAVRRYGQPFLSKFVSGQIYTLQNHDFAFKDKPFSELSEKYPECLLAIKWWCNENKARRYNIDYNKYLKEFMVLNPPKFQISNRCCEYAKKLPAKKVAKKFDCDLMITGIRRNEGGIRAVVYKTCFDAVNNSFDRYRPIFWFSDADKQEYETLYNIEHSRCYTDYWFDRTGCVCCPYSKDFKFERERIQMFEPKLYLACKKLFWNSYEYTEEYNKYKSVQKDEYHKRKKLLKENQ